MSDGLNLLAAICRYKSIENLHTLTDDLFLEGDELDAYDAIRHHYRQYQCLPAVDTLIQDTGIGLAPTQEPLGYYVDRVHERAAYRRIRDNVCLIRDGLDNLDEDMPEIQQAAKNIINAYRRSDGIGDIHTLDKVRDMVFKQYNSQRLSSGITGVTCGWPLLDEETGGYQKGDLIVQVARPGMGKTYLLLHQALAAWNKGARVLLVSMEMSLGQIGNRLFGLHAGINPMFIRKSQMSFYAERKFISGIEAIKGSERFTFIAGNMGKTVFEIDTMIDQLDPDIIFIDGLYLMKTGSASRNAGRYERVAHVLDDVKEMTIRRNTPIVTTTQFNRIAGKQGASGSLENIGYTDAISTHASIIIAIQDIDEDELPQVNEYLSDTGDSSIAVDNSKILKTLKGREGEEARLLVRYGFSPIGFGEIRWLTNSNQTTTSVTPGQAVDWTPGSDS